MRSLLSASLAGALLLASTGCITGRAKTPEPLNMPEPPARVVTPPSTPVEPPPPVVAAPPVATPPPGSSGTPPATSSTPPPPKPAQNTTPATTTPPPESAPVLQTTKDTQNLESQTRWQLESAKRDLERVDRRQLPRDAQAQYDSAMGMWKAAEDAFKIKNFNYAYPLAQKAAIMAAQLGKGRPESFPTSF